GTLGRITASGVMENVVHASADPSEAEREILLWFTPQELLRDCVPIQQSSKVRR
ncbi:MAG: hypothetical protein HY353_04295, partial [Candidatus Omnitrophica bacterium]|nr:hypothetical protein [Candidatus Omnitrophota bacterium]